MRIKQFNGSIRHGGRGLPEICLGGVFHFTFLVISLAIPMAGVSQVKAHAVLQDSNPTKSVGDPSRGRQLFIKDGCFECHGTEAQGGGYTGPRIAPPPPLSLVMSQLRHPSNVMPPFTKKVLSDSDVADIFAFLQSIPVVHHKAGDLIHKGNEAESTEVTTGLEKARKNQPRTVSTKTTADGVYTSAQARDGQVQFSEHCAVCHMANLSGNGQAPSLLGEAFLQLWAGRTVDELYDRSQSTMPKTNPRSLSPDQYLNILAYLLRANDFPAGRKALKREPRFLEDITISEETSSRIGH